MREKTVEVTLIDGSVWTIPNSEFTHFNVPEDPIAIMSNYIRGSRGPLIRATRNSDSVTKHINANFIIDVDVTYLD